MKLAMIGLGKMGANMSRRLMEGGHQVVVFDLARSAVDGMVKEGALGAKSLEDAVGQLDAPRVVWVMVPSGKPTETTVHALLELLQPGDILVEGGNSNYKDSLRQAAAFAVKDIHFVDVGVSGGVWGLEGGYSLMVGGEDQPVRALRSIFETLAPGPDRGWGHVGRSGAGHFTKMVHNGIEYGMMQAYAEGFEILRASDFEVDLKQLSDVWMYGSVIRSWLLELAGRAFAEDPDLEKLEDYVDDSGEGRWTLQEAVDRAVPAPVLYAALMTRFRSRQESSFQSKVLAALRHQFGGHAVHEAGK
jgi:6-phosphogluconate dehydrogenase